MRLSVVAIVDCCQSTMTSTGRANAAADCLSGLPLPSSEPELEDDTEVALTSALTVVTDAV